MAVKVARKAIHITTKVDKIIAKQGENQRNAIENPMKRKKIDCKR